MFSHDAAPKLWVPKYQEFLSLDEISYRKMLALDQTVLIRETPQSSVEQWQEFFKKVTQ